MAKIDVSYQEIDKNGKLYHRFSVTPQTSDLNGKEVVFELFSMVEVKDHDPVHHEKKLLTRKIILDTGLPAVIDVPESRITIFPYKGKKINITIQSRIRIPKKWAIDKKVKQNHYIAKNQPKMPSPICAKHVIEPKDNFNLIKNLSALAPQNMMMALILMAIGGVIIVINTIIGVHDQAVPESQTWLYSHYDSDGDASSPFGQSLVGSGGIGAFVWYLLKKQLRKYMQFHFRPGQSQIKPDTKYSLKNMVTGKSRVDLKNIKLRVVAANIEHGSYMRGSGSNRRRVNFDIPVNGHILYQEHISHIPAKMPIDDYISSETFTFNDVFQKLYPPQMLGSKHGLDLRWEVQLIHHDFIDQELVGQSHIFRKQDFWSHD